LEKIAIVDMGSNTIRMVIFQVSNQAYHLIDDTKETVRLSEKMGEERTLKPAAIKRAMAALLRFMKICRSRGVNRIVPVTTAAVRQAVNGAEFLQKVERETGLVFRILSGQEEAYYGFLGVKNGFAHASGYTLDIGGGSSEVTFFDKRSMEHTVSMPYGALTLSERFRLEGGEGRVASQELRQFLRESMQAVPWIGDRTGMPLFGLGGTVRNIARVHRQLVRYPLESAHHYEMNKSQVDATMEMLGNLTLKELQELPGLSKDRADLIVAGGLIIQTLMETTQAPSLLISGNGLREGLFYEYLHDQVYQEADDDVLMNEVVNLMRYYHVNEEHSRHVAHLSSRLFDELAPIHAMGESARKVLRVAAHLHDVGVAVSFYDWQVHTAYVLLHSKIPGLTHRERLLVALIASFKNKKKMRELLTPYRGLLESEDEDTILKLGILLLIARALDRALSHDIEDLRCSISDKRVHIKLKSVHPDIHLELKEASEYQQRFEKVFGREYVLVEEHTSTQ